MVEYYDIIPYLLDSYKEEKKQHFKIFTDKKPETSEDFKQFILNACKYRFWSRCEYEIIISGFPPQDTNIKIDVYDQVKNNIDLITALFMSIVL